MIEQGRYTLDEVAEALGAHKTTAARRANMESWPHEEVRSSGGRTHLFHPSTLPPDVREALQAKALADALPAIAQDISGPVVLAHDISLTDRQRQARDARLGVAAAVRRVMGAAHCSQESALHTLLTMARSGMLDAPTSSLLRLARDPRGRSGDEYPSIRTLKRWLGADELAPKLPQQDMSVPAWAHPFLAVYQTPQKPTVESAYRQFCQRMPESGRPSIHQVRRFLDKLGSVTRERGRMGARELKRLQPFVRRDFSALEPNDIWSADGHTFDAEVQHPFHGRPFRPEITTFVDIATRRALGWSVDLAESGQAVAGALRHSVERNGIPAILYVDNGPGYINEAIGEEAIGLIGRLGTTMVHSLPYNSQARGVIERLHQTLWVDAARRLPSYLGAAMDREARLEQFKLTRRALKQGGTMPLMPWDLFVSWCEQLIAEYNNRPHRTLGGTSPDLAWRAFEAKGWAPQRLTADEMVTLFRPRVLRKLARCEVQLFSNVYFARELEEFHGLEVHVAYDIHDASRVWVYLPDGRLLCEAQCNGNRRHYMPVAVVDQAREKRAKGRLARVDEKREEILQELHGGAALAAPAASHLIIGGRIVEQTAVSPASAADVAEAPPPDEAKTVTRSGQLQARAATVVPDAAPVTRSERPAADNYAEWLALDQRATAGEILPDADARWHRSYPQSAQYRAEAKKKAAA